MHVPPSTSALADDLEMYHWTSQDRSFALTGAVIGRTIEDVEAVIFGTRLKVGGREVCTRYGPYRSKGCLPLLGRDALCFSLPLPVWRMSSNGKYQI